MTSNKTPDKKVALFILSGLIILLASILTVSGNKFLFSSLYPIKLKLDKIQGLSKGSIVSLAGITIGNISSFEFTDSSSQIEVTIKIDEKYRAKITTDSLARVQTQGALGDKFIYITPGTIDSRPLKDGEFLNADNNKDFLDKIMSTDNGLDHIFDIMVEMKIMLEKINQKNGLVDNLHKSSHALNKLLNETAQLTHTLNKNNTPKELAQTVHQLKELVHKINAGEGTLGQLINDNSLYVRLLEILGPNQKSQYLKSQIRGVIQHSDQQ